MQQYDPFAFQQIISTGVLRFSTPMTLFDRDFPGKERNAENATDTHFSSLAMDGLAERADVGAGASGPPQQLGNALRGSLAVIFGLDAIPAAFLTHMFAEELAGSGIEQADKQLIPLSRTDRPIQPGGAP